MGSIARPETDAFRVPASATEVPALPDAAPMPMPGQSLWDKPIASRLAPVRRVFWPRVIVLGAALLLVGFAGYEMYLVLQIGGLTNLEAIILALYVMLIAWIALSFVTALAGLVSLAFPTSQLDIDPNAPLPDIATRVALLVPTYNERVAHLMARVEAIYRSVEQCGAIDHFDFFILSDTTDAETWIAEEMHLLALRNRTGGHGRIFYRHRANNVGRKAGNIADWVQRFGARYEHMIVLDADSLMTGDTMVRLIAAMERHAGVGLIQTLPKVIGAGTLFARSNQFAGRMYGPAIARGLAWWHGAEGNYWGHNAAIRVRAFAECAGLPVLRGPKPFGGSILSHDFVEAALMRRARWAVHMVPDLAGSYEECPPSLTEYAARDRRWCQGNLQHIGVLPARGLHWVSRLHLLSGIFSYLTAPLWLCFLVVGILISLEAHFVPPEYFPRGFSLFPQWPAQDPVRAAWVFGGTFGLLLLPKLFGYFGMVSDPKLRHGFGGAVRGLLGVILETLISGLTAPILMLMQTVAVVEILLGRDAGWSAQRRDDGNLPFRQVWHRYRWHSLFGLVLAAAAYSVSPPLFLWMTPVIIGLVFAPLLAAATTGTYPLLRRLGLLSIPEERAPPEIVSRSADLSKSLEASEPDRGEILRFFFDAPQLVDWHRNMFPNAPGRPRGQVDAELIVGLAKLDESATLDEALEVLTQAEKRALLGSARGLERLSSLWQSQKARAA